MSGSLTISISGTPRAVQVDRGPLAAVGKPSCRLLPASSSRCTRVMPILFCAPSVGLDFDVAMLGQRLVVLRNLVALGQVGIEVVLAGEDRSLVGSAVQRRRRQHGKLHRPPFSTGKRTRQTETHRAHVGVRRIAKVGRAAAEDFVWVRSWTCTSSPMTGSYLDCAATGLPKPCVDYRSMKTTLARACYR